MAAVLESSEESRLATAAEALRAATQLSTYPAICLSAAADICYAAGHDCDWRKELQRPQVLEELSAVDHARGSP